MAETETPTRVQDGISGGLKIPQLAEYELRGIINPDHPNVFLGRHKESGLEVVVKAARPIFVKSIKPELDPMLVGNICLCYEHAIQETLDHPNILSPIELYRQNDDFYLVTPRVGETDLYPQDSYIRKLPEQVKLSLLAQTASALSYCKKEGLVHLDIKPANIRVENKKATLIDFGAARRLGERHCVIDKIAMSTPDVAAPEHRFDSIITPSADVFSFACLAYELLTGHKPFEYIDHFEVLRYKSPLHDRKAVARFGKTGELIIKGMAYKHTERPEIEELAEALREQSARYYPQPSEQPSVPSPVLV
ncbi:Protein kinase domain protein [uncultured archaeon]|nr:Protein kinase domain protein [uncultured archaeon]